MFLFGFDNNDLIRFMLLGIVCILQLISIKMKRKYKKRGLLLGD